MNAAFDGDDTIREPTVDALSAAIDEPSGSASKAVIATTIDSIAAFNLAPSQREKPWQKALQQQLANSGKPVIQISGGSLPDNVDAAEHTLIEHDKNIFQRGDLVVRPAPKVVEIADQRKTTAMRLVTVKAAHLTERLTRIIDFKKYDVRAKKWAPVDCPAKIAMTYLERIGDWKLPILTGIVNAPTLRPDGSILDQPGYDARTGILYRPTEEFPEVPRLPTPNGARQALDHLISLIAEFPFVGKDGEVALGKPSPSRSVALSAMLTTPIRQSIPNAPLHGFSAPVISSGKSKLVDIASMLANGHEAPVIAQGKTEEEMEKRLGAELLEGSTFISLDNCERPLSGDLLCQVLTQRTVKVRILGQSVNVEVLANAMLAATGNNLQVFGDATRRVIVATLDPKAERPELREFPNDPIEMIRSDRPSYVLAALAVLRAYVVAGKPAQHIRPLGSFSEWSNWVRSALIWLGEADPCATMDDVRKDDPKTQAVTATLCNWYDVFGDDDVPVAKVIKAAQQTDSMGDLEHPEFHGALMDVAGDRDTISNVRLGHWLKKNKGRIVNGLCLEPSGTFSRSGGVRWRVQKY